MAHFIKRNKIKLGLLTLTPNISKSWCSTKTINMAFESPDNTVVQRGKKSKSKSLRYLFTHLFQPDMV